MNISPSDIKLSLDRTISWLADYGELSWDVDDYFNNAYGRWAKRQYYERPWFGTLCVAPLVFQEAFTPWTRRFFWPAQRFPLADAHFAMGFAYLHQATGEKAYYDRARHFLDVLWETRCPKAERFGWGYPFGWETVWGNFSANVPLITTTPYGYEAFAAVHAIDGDPRWLEIMRAVAEHGLRDYNETEHAPGIFASSYAPIDRRRVVNANAYRAFLLTAASRQFASEEYWSAAQRPLGFVLHVQEPDGSWIYAHDGWDKFIDHYHTCFVLKALTKIERLTGHEGCRTAIARGVEYYFKNLIDERGLPKPFAKPPRLIIYRRELYDLAEAINLSLLLRDRFPQFNTLLQTCLEELLHRWQMKNGAFPTRQLLIGWNRVPMHRWGLSIAFRSLALYLHLETARNKQPASAPSAGAVAG
jgi:hypothetical protein